MKSLPLVALSEQLYLHLLILYPPQFRHEYGREMVLVFRSQCRNRVQQFGQTALVSLWLSTFTDLVSTALSERMKEKYSMSKIMWVQLCGIFAVIGGILGTYLALQSANEYGNYGWYGELAPVAGILLTIGFAGWFIAYHETVDMHGRVGFVIALVGFLGMAMGFLIENLWPLIFIGPTILVPIGGILLGISSSRVTTLPAWWRLFPYVIAAIGILAFGVEAWEEFVLRYSTPDRGVMLLELLYSLLWMALGVGLWLVSRRSASQPNVM